MVTQERSSYDCILHIAFTEWHELEGSHGALGGQFEIMDSKVAQDGEARRHSQLSCGLWHAGVRNVFGPFPVGQVVILAEPLWGLMTKDTATMAGTVTGLPGCF